MARKNKWLERDLLTLPHITLCLNEKDFKATVKSIMKGGYVPEFLVSGAHGTMHTFESTDGGMPTCVVCIQPHESDPISTTSLIVHEAVHVWQVFRDYIGEKDPSREFEAYGVQRIAHILLQEYERQTANKD